MLNRLTEIIDSVAANELDDLAAFFLTGDMACLPANWEEKQYDEIVALFNQSNPAEQINAVNICYHAESSRKWQN